MFADLNELHYSVSFDPAEPSTWPIYSTARIDELVNKGDARSCSEHAELQGLYSFPGNLELASLEARTILGEELNEQECLLLSEAYENRWQYSFYGAFDYPDDQETIWDEIPASRR